jgi:hypothetical protein
MFEGALLKGANFTGANLFDARFDGAELERAIFSNALLQNTHFGAAALEWTMFDAVDLSGATGLESIVHRAPSAVTLATVYRSRGRIPEALSNMGSMSIEGGVYSFPEARHFCKRAVLGSKCISSQEIPIPQYQPAAFMYLARISKPHGRAEYETLDSNSMAFPAMLLGLQQSLVVRPSRDQSFMGDLGCRIDVAAAPAWLRKRSGIVTMRIHRLEMSWQRSSCPPKGGVMR